MISRLVMSNFQSHRFTEIDFSPGVNAIVGPSDSGKSSVLRALRWVIDGRPSGDSYKRNGTNDVKVTLFQSGKSVSRSRNGNKNLYETDTEQFAAFGMSVPEPIEKILNFSDINVQSQMDAPFLLSSTPGEVARYLNGVLGLDKIDSSLAKILSESRSISKDKKGIISDLETARGSLSDYDNLDDIINRFDLVKKMDEKKRIAESELATLSSIIDGFNSIEEIDVPDLDHVIVDIEKLLDFSEKCKKERASLSEAVTVLQETERKIKLLSEPLADVKKELERLKPAICPTCGQLIPEGVTV